MPCSFELSHCVKGAQVAWTAANLMFFSFIYYLFWDTWENCLCWG